MRLFLACSSQVLSIFNDGAQALCGPLPVLTTPQQINLSLFCKYMSAKEWCREKAWSEAFENLMETE